MKSLWVDVNNWLQHFLGNSFKDVLWSVLVIIILMVLYSTLSLLIRNQKKSEKKKYYSLNTIRNSFFIIFVFFELFIWSGELKTLVLSAAAIFAATIVTFKEVIMCLVGSFLISSNKLFSNGEYIEYDGLKGKIIDKNLLYTKILIGESFQTKELNIPNAFFISNKVINLSRFGKFQCYDLKIAVEKIIDIPHYKKFFNTLLKDLLHVYEEQYIAYFNEKKIHDIFFEMPTEYYNIKCDMQDIDSICFKISFLSLPLNRKEIEETIMNKYIEELNVKNERKENE